MKEELEEDGVLKKLKRNFIFHNICNLVLGIVVIYVGITEGLSAIGFPLVMLGFSFMATGITCGCIAKRIKYLNQRWIKLEKYGSDKK